MKRLMLSFLLGVVCLALLSAPAGASLHDPTKPSPTPYTNISDDNIYYGDGGWGDLMQSYRPGGQPGITNEQSETTTTDVGMITRIQRFVQKAAIAATIKIIRFELLKSSAGTE
jgi:hypothetical protein